MTNRTIIAFDFGTKSIGAAIGQEITGTARALAAFKAQDGVPDWQKIRTPAERMAARPGGGWLTVEYGWHRAATDRTSA